MSAECSVHGTDLLYGDDDEYNGPSYCPSCELDALKEGRVYPTRQGDVAAFYYAKLGRLPTPYEARERLVEEIRELDDALALDVPPEAALKELADVVYTCYGYALSRGWDLHHAFERVHASNMTKEPTVSGKIQKGAAYVPPDLRGCV